MFMCSTHFSVTVDSTSTRDFLILNSYSYLLFILSLTIFWKFIICGVCVYACVCVHVCYLILRR